MDELAEYALTRELASKHLTTIRRASVLLARLAAGEKLSPEDRVVVLDVRKQLRVVGDLLEGGL